MRNFNLLLTIIILGSGNAFSQSTGKPDLIYKKNNTILETTIDSVYSDYIQYKLFRQINGSLRKVYLRDVSKIKYADGSIREIGGQAEIVRKETVIQKQEVVAQHVAVPEDAVKHEVKKEVVTTPEQRPEPAIAEQKPDHVKIKKGSTDAFHRISLSAGGEFLFYPAFLNDAWANKESGFAMDFAYGGSVRFGFRPVKILAISITAGYSSFELERLYKPEEDLTMETLYADTQTFNQIPLSGGIKFYLKKGFYILPEAGITLVKTKVTTSAEHPTPDVGESYSSKPVSYGLGVGVEINTKGAVFFDLSLRFQYLNVKNFNISSLSQTYNKPLGSASFRIGIGFGANKH